MDTDVDVLADLQGRTVAVGVAHFTRSAKSMSTTFEYDGRYLAEPDTPQVDPAFPLFSGNQHVKRMPGAFGDSAPDRWGRRILARREREQARVEDRTPRTLDEVDFLLAVNDLTRQGNLRYRLRGSDDFLSADHDIPSQIELPELLRAADAVDADGDDDEVSAALKTLLRAGTGTLGGARPKASILMRGRLAIAKFPSVKDAHDVIGWEAVALDIAAAAGIRVPEHDLVSIGGRHVLILDRFDRDVSGNRLGYMSAMTMLEAVDGDNGDYVEIAETLADTSAHVAADRAELFDRAVLSVLLHNTDDHLRNHGFVHDASGWKLSPLFDVNPNPDQAEGRSTSIAGADMVADEWDGLMALAGSCDLLEPDAAERVQRVAEAAAAWSRFADQRDVSDKLGVGPRITSRAATLAQTSDALLMSRPPQSTPRRGKTSNSSNRGSFAPRRRDSPSRGL